MKEACILAPGEKRQSPSGWCHVFFRRLTVFVNDFAPRQKEEGAKDASKRQRTCSEDRCCIAELRQITRNGWSTRKPNPKATPIKANDFARFSGLVTSLI